MSKCKSPGDINKNLNRIADDMAAFDKGGSDTELLEEMRIAVIKLTGLCRDLLKRTVTNPEEFQ
jgi:hypothetical protein